MNDIVQLIAESSSIALITHINPDGDAIGSTIALMHALDKIGNLWMYIVKIWFLVG